MKLFWMILFLAVVNITEAQDSIRMKKTLKVIKNKKVYIAAVAENPAQAMVDITQFVPGIMLDLRYATNNNFTGQKIYPATKTTYLRKKAAQSLASIQMKLKLKGMGLKVFDAYRPFSATELIWSLVKDERYAAKPEKGSNHNRGVAVDVTIIDLKTNKELDMGTNFDNFSDTAHHYYKGLPGTVLKNRKILRHLMEQNGFTAMETEWWHYSLTNTKQYELLDLSFDELKDCQGKIKKN